MSDEQFEKALETLENNKTSRSKLRQKLTAKSFADQMCYLKKYGLVEDDNKRTACMLIARLNYKNEKEPKPQAQVIPDFWTGLRELSNNTTFDQYDIQQDLEQYASRHRTLSLILNGTTVELEYSLRSGRSTFVLCKGDKRHNDNNSPALANGTNLPWGSIFRVVLRDASDIIVFSFARLPSTPFVLAQSVLDQPDCNTLVLLFNPFKRMLEDDEEPETAYAFPEERRFGSLHPSCPEIFYADPRNGVGRRRGTCWNGERQGCLRVEGIRKDR